MKTIIALTIACILVVSNSFAQLRGSGKTISKTYDYKNFDKVSFEDIDGKIEVEIGKLWSISVAIDDNLESLLTFSENTSENELKVAFKNNRNNRMYIEDTNVTIKITMPEASVIKNSGNSNITVMGVVGRYFRIEVDGNGDATCSGSVDQLDVEKTGNGDVHAREIKAKNAKIKSSGNGDVVVNVAENLTAKNNGNGDVKNIGKAAFDSSSKSIGNGELIRL
jgi:Putative auto-transporter adhesin, head GIN domain